MAVLIDRGRITGIAPFSQAARPDGAQFVDWSDATVVPGFIDSHVHLLFSHFSDHRTTRARVENATAAGLAAIGAHNAAECLSGGVTTVRDCGDRDFAVLGLRDAVAAHTTPGPRILAAGPPVTTPNGHLYWCGNVVDEARDVVRATRETCARGVDLIKVMASGGIMTEGSDKFATQFEASELSLLVAEAHRHGKPVAAHALNTDSIRVAFAAGVDTIEHCAWLSPDGQPRVDVDLVKRMANSAVSVTITLAGINRAMMSDGGRIDTAQRRDALAFSPSGNLFDDFAWAREMLAAGVHMTLASDAGVRLTPFREFGHTIECGVQALGLTLSQSISLATIRAAEALGIDSEVGSVEIGKQADLVVVDGLIDEQSTRLGEIRQVWRGGSVVA